MDLNRGRTGVKSSEVHLMSLHLHAFSMSFILWPARIWNSSRLKSFFLSSSVIEARVLLFKHISETSKLKFFSGNVNVLYE